MNGKQMRTFKKDFEMCMKIYEEASTIYNDMIDFIDIVFEQIS